MRAFVVVFSHCARFALGEDGSFLTASSAASDTPRWRLQADCFACVVHESGRGDSGLDLETLGEKITKIQGLREAGKLQRQEFYCADPHVEVSLPNTGETNYQLVCRDDTVGDIGSFYLLREAPRNALYRHNGKTYRVKDVIRGKRIVRVAEEWTRNETVSFVQKTIRQKAPLRLRQYSQFTFAVARLDVTEFLKTVTEKDASGKTVRMHPGTGMPTHYLPTEGVCLKLTPAFMQSLQAAIDIRLEVAVASIERLMANLFPTVSGPCDSQDYSSGIDKTKSGELAIFLYDNVYDGVNLTEIAFDEMPALLAKVRERIETCDCTEDQGCVRCIADPMRETTTSKAASLTVLERLSDIFRNEEPRTADFSSQNDGFMSTSTQAQCAACQFELPSNARFCSNCGTPV